MSDSKVIPLARRGERGRGNSRPPDDARGKLVIANVMRRFRRLGRRYRLVIASIQEARGWIGVAKSNPEADRLLNERTLGMGELEGIRHQHALCEGLLRRMTRELFEPKQPAPMPEGCRGNDRRKGGRPDAA